MKKISLIMAGWLAMSVGIVQAADAKTNWDGKCAGCHGKLGKGDTKIGQKMGARDYSDPKIQATVKDDQIFKAVKEGLKKDGKELMKPFADKLTDEEIKALVTHMRSLKKD